MHQFDSSGLRFARYDDQREMTVRGEHLIVDQNGAFFCIPSTARNDADGLITLPEDILAEIENSRFDKTVRYDK